MNLEIFTVVTRSALVVSLIFALTSARSGRAEEGAADGGAAAPATETIYLVTNYGPLHPGKNVTNEQKEINTQTIQSAINACGVNGGGVVLMPEGYYCVTLLGNQGSWPACLNIAYDNVTFKGAGISSTTIQTRGEWNLVNGEVLRGHGIRIDGTHNPNNPRRNITISDMEIYGGTDGFTGNFDWPANTTTGDGWDISHKGIVVCHDDFVDQVMLENLYIHDFKGEVVYGGGHGLSRVTIKNSKLSDTNADLVSLAGNLVCDNVEFDLCFAYVENVPLHPMKFLNCSFSRAKRNGVSITKSPDFGTWEGTTSTEIGWCTFSNSDAAAIALGAKAYRVRIHNNTFVNHSVAVRGLHSTKDVKVWDNHFSVDHGGENYFVQIYDANHHWDIYGNTVISGPGARTFSLGYAGFLRNVRLHHNEFMGVEPPYKMWALDRKSEKPKVYRNSFN